jgi:hypothetical protein
LGNSGLNVAQGPGFICKFPKFRPNSTALPVNGGARFAKVACMQTLPGTLQKPVVGQSLGLHVMLLSQNRAGLTEQRLAEHGGLVDRHGDVDLALSRIKTDPIGFDLLVMDCDGLGGVDGAIAVIAALVAADARMRVILISQEFDEPVYPFGMRAAVCLPASVPDDGFRRGLQHVLRDRVQVTLM